MGADMHIHIVTDDVTPRMLSKFGAEWCIADGEWHKAYEVISDTPQVWVGEVSWLKAALFDDKHAYLPGAVERIAAIIPCSHSVPITNDLIEQVGKAFDIPNTTQYDLASRDQIVAFLNEHKGNEAFTVSW